MIDMTCYRHPVLAVSCPDCHARVGAWCRRPSGHQASDFHKARKTAADHLFVAQYGEAASIERTEEGWRIVPNGRLGADSAGRYAESQPDLFGQDKA